ncbi:radical SAM protein [Stappia sp. BW2]|uniref:radical SAM/SPASM domain-containing protein n=1 Tax=Stappia sp. BW2 TaxID=2592622 RepID=UPI0011DE995E|nr:radical SAM protein [Stappia sp. BW2]TYC68292.1 radical SAM protein [Stappia sp. BW2]
MTVHRITDNNPTTRPRSSRMHLFGGDDAHVLEVETGVIRKFDPARAHAVNLALDLGDTRRAEQMALGSAKKARAPDPLPETAPLKALSLAVAQKCNLGCSYCYAQQGTFGGDATAMGAAVAKEAVDRLLDGAQPGGRITLAFMGGEPLTNRPVLHAATRYAARKGQALGIGVGFSLTTNATLINPEDVALFQHYGFALTISVDGLQGTHDRLRPFAGGRGSFAQVERALARLRSVPDREFRLDARVTVTPFNLDLSEILTGLAGLGFDGVMFSPMLTAPNGRGQMGAAELNKMLGQLVQCGQAFLDSLETDRPLPFTNLTMQLKRIHRYQRDSYPCGAGGGYLGVSAKGTLHACHRFVDDDAGYLGNVAQGVDPVAQSNWLRQRNLSAQGDCTSCWARYLCSGSCHYEVLKRGRPGCDYIRGWLDYCLGVYATLAMRSPDQMLRLLDQP